MLSVTAILLDFSTSLNLDTGYPQSSSDSWHNFALSLMTFCMANFLSRTLVTAWDPTSFMSQISLIFDSFDTAMCVKARQQEKLDNIFVDIRDKNMICL